MGGVLLSSAKSVVHSALQPLKPAADVLAAGTIEVNLSEIDVGQVEIKTWRGKPLFLHHRTADQIADARAVDVSTLRDPQTDDERIINPRFLITLGICTHLGCVPLPNQGDYNGYFCPCHGSHYDSSGRIRAGPAPLNLEVPPYKFTEDLVARVG